MIPPPGFCHLRLCCSPCVCYSINTVPKIAGKIHVDGLGNKVARGKSAGTPAPVPFLVTASRDLEKNVITCFVEQTTGGGFSDDIVIPETLVTNSSKIKEKIRLYNAEDSDPA